MTFKIDKKGVAALLLIIVLMILTRSHNPFSGIHLPDFTIPALFMTGIYFRHWFYPVTICITAVMIDNYAIVEQGVSANCITPAYTFLPLAYLGVHWSAKYINTLALKNRHQLLNVVVFVVLITALEWLFTSMSYYAFTSAAWSNFPVYALQWAPLALSYIFYWMMAITVVFTLVHRLKSLHFSTGSQH